MPVKKDGNLFYLKNNKLYKEFNNYKNYKNLNCKKKTPIKL